MNIRLTAIEARIVGALIEKQITTPDQYPLSLNALINACNQKSNREPLMQLDEATVKFVVDGLGRRHIVVEKSGFGSRVPKYQQIFCNTEFGSLKFTPQETAIVCELLLRGPQTPGELRSRAPRMAEFPEPGVVESMLEGLANRPDGAHRRATRRANRAAAIRVGRSCSKSCPASVRGGHGRRHRSEQRRQRGSAAIAQQCRARGAHRGTRKRNRRVAHRARRAQEGQRRVNLPAWAQSAGLLVISNVFMTFAWYAHLKNMAAKPWVIAALASWGIALFEYLVQVPANRIGYTAMSLGQLKVMQEVITLAVFVPFALFYMKQPLKLDFLWAGLCLVAAAYFMFRSN